MPEFADIFLDTAFSKQFLHCFLVFLVTFLASTFCHPGNPLSDSLALRTQVAEYFLDAMLVDDSHALVRYA